MNVGSLVTYKAEPGRPWQGDGSWAWPNEFSIGIITGFQDGRAIVHWSMRFPHEEEYLDQIEVISECR